MRVGNRVSGVTVSPLIWLSLGVCLSVCPSVFSPLSVPCLFTHYYISCFTHPIAYYSLRGNGHFPLSSLKSSRNMQSVNNFFINFSSVVLRFFVKGERFKTSCSRLNLYLGERKTILSYSCIKVSAKIRECGKSIIMSSFWRYIWPLTSN